MTRKTSKTHPASQLRSMTTNYSPDLNSPSHEADHHLQQQHPHRQSCYSEITLSAAGSNTIIHNNDTLGDGSSSHASETRSQYGAISLCNVVHYDDQSNTSSRDHNNTSSSLFLSITGSDSCCNMRKRIKNFSAKKTLHSLVPLVPRLQDYSLRRDLIADIIAGLTLAILQVPQAIAYALLVGVAPSYGLYTSIFPVFIYAFLGSAHHISIGTMAVVDIMLRGMIDKYSSNNSTIALTREITESVNQQDFEDAAKIQIMTSICLLTGLCQVVFGILHLGTVSLIFSDQLISGFSCGAAITVVMSQIPTALEIHGVTKSTGPLALIYQSINIFSKINTCNTTALILSGIALLVYIMFRTFMKKRLEKVIPFPIPIDLMIVIAATCACKYLYLNEKYSVAIIGEIRAGIPAPILPVLTMTTIKSGMLLDSAVLAVVCFAIAFSLGKIYAKQHGYEIHANQELFALGSANTFASFFSCFPATASLSRTAVMGETAKSHVSSLVSCVILVLLLLFFAPALETLPKSVVAVIIIVAQKSLVMQVMELKSTWNTSVWEGMIWLVTFVSVLLLGIDLGLLVGITFSVFMIVKRNSSPKLRKLGKAHDSDQIVELDVDQSAYEIPGVKIVQFSTPLFFLNSGRFKEKMLKECMWLQSAGDSEYYAIHTMILDCSAISFIDTTGVRAVTELSDDLAARDISLLLTCCHADVISLIHKTCMTQDLNLPVIVSTVSVALQRRKQDADKRETQKQCIIDADNNLL